MSFKVEGGMDKFVYHPIYVLLVFFVIFPIQGLIVLQGKVLLGVILFLMQMPWFYSGTQGKFNHTVKKIKEW